MTGTMRLMIVSALAASLGTGCGQTLARSSTAPTAMTPSAAAPSPASAADTKAATLRTTLNTLLAEHVWLAADATGAALAGREDEFKAAAGVLDANSVAIAAAIGSVYGADAERAFLPLWRKHIGFAVDYTVGVATRDRPRQDRAVSDLVQYSEDFGAFLASANPNLPRNAVAGLVKHHVVTLKDVIDAQASGDQARAYAARRTAAQHMSMIADPLASAIVAQFPDRFGG